MEVFKYPEAARKIPENLILCL